MKRILAVSGLLATLFCSASTASATLIEADLFHPGDGLLTLDTDTKLEWLDVTQTRNMSVNDVLASAAGWTDLRYGLATSLQVDELFSNAGIPDIGEYSVPNKAPVVSLIALLGSVNVPEGARTEGHSLDTGPSGFTFALPTGPVGWTRGWCLLKRRIGWVLRTHPRN